MGKARTTLRLRSQARRLTRLPAEEVLLVHSALCLLFAGPLLYGKSFHPEWSELWRRARRWRLLDNPHLRMQLALMGSYVGDCRAHVAWLMDERARSHEITDTLCFTRRDVSPSLRDATARHIRGGRLPLGAALFEAAPASSVRHLVDYVRTCMRSPHHLESEGLTLMLLTWVDETSNLLCRLGERSLAFEEDIKSLALALRKLEHVQVMEKSRFWRLLDRTRAGPGRERLQALWRKAYL